MWAKLNSKFGESDFKEAELSPNIKKGEKIVKVKKKISEVEIRKASCSPGGLWLPHITLGLLAVSSVYS